MVVNGGRAHGPFPPPYYRRASWRERVEVVGTVVNGGRAHGPFPPPYYRSASWRERVEGRG